MTPGIAPLQDSSRIIASDYSFQKITGQIGQIPEGLIMDLGHDTVDRLLFVFDLQEIYDLIDSLSGVGADAEDPFTTGQFQPADCLFHIGGPMVCLGNDPEDIPVGIGCYIRRVEGVWFCGADADSYNIGFGGIEGYGVCQIEILRVLTRHVDQYVVLTYVLGLLVGDLLSPEHLF